MSLPANSLEQLFQFEGNLESGFIQLLTNAGLANVGSSRSSQEFKTPYVSLYFQNGKYIQETQQSPNGLVGADGRTLPYCGFEGILSTECVTNRTDDLRENEHLTLIAKLRKNLQMFRLASQWTKVQQISLVFDIREAGTTDTWEDEYNLDHTMITWDIRHAINPAAWPENILD